MASKLEYLQRYMSGGGGDSTDPEKKRKKKAKKSKKAAALGTRVVDADEVWEHSAPSREDIDKKWEMDAAEDEKPQVVVADGDEMVDPQDLPVYVDSDRYLDEFRGKKEKQKEDNDGDLSPPRKPARQRDTEEASASRNEASSPPRRRVDAAKRVVRRRRGDSEEDGGDASPPRRARADASPPRRQSMRQAETRGRRTSTADEDASPPRRGREASSRGRHGDDASPPRRSSGKAPASRRARDEDASPPLGHKEKEDGFASAARNSSAAKVKDASPPRRTRRDEGGSQRDERKRSSSRSLVAADRQRRVDSLGRDIPPQRPTSPPGRDGPSNRRRHRSASRSPSRTRERSHERASPPRRRERRSRSRSPRSRRRGSRSPSPRRQRSPRKTTRWGPSERRESTRERSRSRERRRSPSRSQSASPQRRASRRGDVKDARNDPGAKARDGKEEKKAGLFTADEFEQQRKLAAQRKDVLHGVDAAEMGAKAETVYRDKRGRKLDMLNEMVRQQEVLDGKRKREEREEYEWGTGEVQKRERKTQQEILEQMKKMPFARLDDDEELERKRRERVRAFDPINSKVFQEDPLAEGKSKKQKKSKGQKKATKAKPKYAGPPAPPNRFGIRPGYRWDGVVRGSNWEEKIMMRQNANTAVSEEAYKYAVADM